MTIAPGHTLGPYELVAPIGHGGMGEVWRARDPRIGREVAIKILPRDFASSPDRLRRFEQEARAAGALNHPNLVTIHEFGTSDGAPFLAMELLEGETLRDRMADGRLPVKKAVDYAIQIATGLAAAHEKGIVHRDLKPENVFITKDGRLKILDFGLAKLRADALLGPNDTTIAAHRATAPGTVMGTAGYMSPEQVRGIDVDHRTDIFALGAILYEMLCGRRAFDRATSVETMSAVLTDEPPEISSDGARISPAIERVVRRCIEKERALRFHSASDVAYALDAVTSSSSIGSSAAPAPPRSTRRAAMMSVLIAAAVLLGLSGGFFGSRLLHRAAVVHDPHFTQLTFSNGVDEEASIAPDATSFAFVRSVNGVRDIFVQRVGGANAINLTNGAGGDNSEPAFSPDGQQIAFRSERDGGGIFVMGATGESVRRVSDFGFNPSWSPDGKSIVCATEGIADPAARYATSELWAIDTTTSQRHKIETNTDAVQPSWSPHGTRIAFWSVVGGRRTIATVPAAGGAPVTVVNDGAMNWNPVWSATGDALYYVSDRAGGMNLQRIAVDETSGNPRGPAESVTVSPQWSGQISVARDGTIAFVTRSGDWAIWGIGFDPVAMRFTGPAAPVPVGTHRILLFSVSPDGRSIAFSTIGPDENIYIARLDGSEVRQLTNDRFRNRAPRFNPDGSRLVFFSNRGGDYDIWTIRTDGSDLQQLTFGSGGLVVPVWSPDGTKIAAVAGQKTKDARNKTAIFKPVPHAPLRWLPPGPHGEPIWPTQWSSDSRRLLGPFPAASGIPHGAAAFNLDTNTYDVYAEDGELPVWIDDHSIVMLKGQHMQHLDTTTHKVTDLGPAPFRLMSPYLIPSPDRRTIYYVSGATISNVWMLK